MNFTPFPEIETERLVLRQLIPSDAAVIQFLRSDPEVNKFIVRPTAETLEDALAFIKKVNTGIENNENIYWCIANKLAPSKMLGSISLWHFSEDKLTGEVGYDLHTDSQAKGIMTEALKAVLNYGFKDLQLQTIEAYTQFENKASIKLLKKQGFNLLPDRKDEGFPKNIIFSLKKGLSDKT